MRQNRTLRASSVRASRWVFLCCAFICSLSRGDYDGPLSTLNPRNTHLGLLVVAIGLTWYGPTDPPAFVNAAWADETVSSRCPQILECRGRVRVIRESPPIEKNWQ